MPYQSQPLSLEFWNRLMSRIQSDFDANSLAVTDLLLPLPATVDTATALLAQVKLTREEVHARLGYMERMQVLLANMSAQVRTAAFEAQVPDLEQRLASMRKIIGLITHHMSGLPRREPAEQDLERAADQYARLSNSGQGETITAERMRLRAITRDLRVMGAEDGLAYEQTARNLQTSADQMAAELQSLLVSTMVSLEVSDTHCAILQQYGIQVELIPQPEAQPDAQASADILPGEAAVSGSEQSS